MGCLGWGTSLGMSHWKCPGERVNYISQEATGVPVTRLTPVPALTTLSYIHHPKEHREGRRVSNGAAAAAAPTRQTVLLSHDHSNLRSRRREDANCSPSAPGSHVTSLHHVTPEAGGDVRYPSNWLPPTPLTPPPSLGPSGKARNSEAKVGEAWIPVSRSVQQSPDCAQTCFLGP